MKKLFTKYLNAAINIGVEEGDSEYLRLKKASLTLIPLIIGIAAFIWGILYILLDHYISASIPLSYSVVSAFNLWHLKKTKNIVPIQQIQMILVLILPFALMWTLGGFALGSFVFIWAFFAPIAALTYEEKSKSMYWFYAFISLVVFSTLIDQNLIENHKTFMPQIAVELFFLLNISAGLAGIFYLIKYFIEEKEKISIERLQNEHEILHQRTQELYEANEKLEYFASHDVLTGLPNRYYLQDNLKKMMAYAKRYDERFALLFVDLDGFKSINDEYGHAKGDVILKSVSKRMKSLLRGEDTVARIGGDEFAIAVRKVTDIKYVENIAERIIEEINRNYDSIPSSSLGASIGISFFPEHAQDIDTLISRADHAMYTVKKSSKNAYLIYSKGENDDD